MAIASSDILNLGFIHLGDDRLYRLISVGCSFLQFRHSICNCALKNRKSFSSLGAMINLRELLQLLMERLFKLNLN